MVVAAFAVVAGLALLVWGSDRFVAGAAATARNLDVSPLVIGLTVVGVGTSAPEIMVSATAALDGNPGVAIGNSLGSNIANIGLVLGVTAVVRAIDVQSQTLRRELPIMFVVLLVAWVLFLDGELGRFDGGILMAGFVALLGYMIWLATRVAADPLREEFDQQIATDLSTTKALMWTVVGLVVLLAGSRATVWGAVSIARDAGVSDFLIGLTIVAIGTSLPELAACVASALKGEPDLAIGNVIGSNMFNLLPVLAIPALATPGPVPPEAIGRDFPVMLALAVVLFILCGVRGRGRIDRWEGGVLLAAFCAYQALLYTTVGHPGA